MSAAATVAAAPRRLVVLAGRHRLFCSLFAAGLALRMMAWLAFQPVLFFYGDSYSYLSNSRGLTPNPIRPIGYPALLHVLLWTHTLATVPAVQHVFGLATAVLGYAVLRRLGAGGVVAALCTAPLLLDGYLIDIEQNLLAESMFMLLVTGGLALLVWRSRPSPLACAAVGGLLGAAALTRTVGIVLIAPVLLYCLLRWFGLVRIALLSAGFAIPLIGYALWFGATWGQIGVTKHDGYFLYGRVSSFARCSAWNVPAAQRFLCFGEPPSQRPNPNHYVWAEWTTPRYRGHPFALDGRLRQFALEAIRHQPLAYASTILGDLAHYASPGHSTNRWDTPLSHWRFPTSYRIHHIALTRHVVEKFGGHLGVQRSLAQLLRSYQAVVYVQGPLLAAAVLAGLAAALVGLPAAAGRRLRAEPLLFALVGLALPTTAAATTMFDYRYTLPAIPPLCLAAGTAVTVAAGHWRKRRPAPQPVAEPAAAQVGEPLVAEIR